MTPNVPDDLPERIGRVPSNAHGLRLDKALSLVFPDLAAAGLRARRRLCERGCVRLQQRCAGPAAKVRAGEVLALAVRRTDAVPTTCAPDEVPVVVRRDTLFAALYKPGGLHSAALVGSPEPSLEEMLPDLLGVAPVTSPSAEPGFQKSVVFPCLLNRLDRETSGLVLAAYAEVGRRIWRKAEDEGKTDKRYLAVLEGHLKAPVSVCAALDVADRRKSRILDHPTADPLRCTEAAPLGVFPASRILPGATGLLTLAGCRIRKGARHQIRAHLAAAGYPLAGDALYGNTHGKSHFLLHHACLRLPGFAALFLPAWLPLLPEQTADAARTWLAC